MLYRLAGGIKGKKDWKGRKESKGSDEERERFTVEKYLGYYAARWGLH